MRRSFAADVVDLLHLRRRVPWRGFEFHVGAGAFAGVFPTHDGEACVWLCRPTALLERRTPRRGAARPSALVDALDEAAPALGRARPRRSRGLPVRGVRRPAEPRPPGVRPGWALVGDAGYHRDPITGHGITDAFRDAELLADALATRRSTAPVAASGGAARYERARDDALGDDFALTRALAAFPAPARFVELQIELSEALDREAPSCSPRARRPPGSTRRPPREHHPAPTREEPS